MNSLVQKQMLKAFADDIVCILRNKDELKQVIKSFELLMNEFNIHINKKKSQYVCKDKPGETFTETEGISRVKDYKYLGLTVTHGKKKILKMAKDTVERQVKQLGSAVNGCVTRLRENAYKVFIRSRLSYQMIPLVAAGMIDIEGVLNCQR